MNDVHCRRRSDLGVLDVGSFINITIRIRPSGPRGDTKTRTFIFPQRAAVSEPTFNHHISRLQSLKIAFDFFPSEQFS